MKKLLSLFALLVLAFGFLRGVKGGLSFRVLLSGWLDIGLLKAVLPMQFCQQEPKAVFLSEALSNSFFVFAYSAKYAVACVPPESFACHRLRLLPEVCHRHQRRETDRAQ